MTIEELKMLSEDVRETKRLNLEAKFRMARYCLTSYLRCFIVFGPTSPITKDCLNVMREYSAIINEENYLLTCMLKSDAPTDRIDYFYGELNDLSEKTINYYYKVLDDIDDASYTGDEWRAKRDRKNFSTLIETDDYRNILKTLSIDIDDVEEFLNLPEEFWEFVKPRIVWKEPFEELPRYYYRVNLIENEQTKTIEDFTIILPTIINLNTAKICVHELSQAYSIYRILNTKLTNEQEYSINKSSKEQEETFEHQYVLTKYSKKLK